MVSKKIEFIAYKGLEYTIEWYFNPQGKSPALEYFNNLTRARQKKLDNLLELMGEQGRIHNINRR